MQLVLALVTLLVGVHAGGQILDLSAITKNSLAVTSSTPDSSTGYAISALVTDATVIADAVHLLNVNFNVTFTGTLPTGGQGSWDPLVTSITGPGTDAGAAAFTCSQGTAGHSLGSGFSRQGTNVFTFTGGFFPALTATGSYTATITLFVYGVSQATATFTFTASGAYTAPVLKHPTFATFAVTATRNVSTPQIAATFTAASFDAVTYAVSAYFSSSAGSQAVVWSSSQLTSSAAVISTDGWSPLQPAIGYWCGGAFFESLSFSGATQFPQGLAVSVGGVSVAGAGGANILAPSGTFTATTGTTDLTAPTCTTSNFAATTITTSPGSNTVAVTTVCSDGTGTGVAMSGAIVRATDSTSGLTGDALVFNGLSYSVPLFHTGSVQIIGVFAVDQAGNGVVYGSCGGTVGPAATTLCGGGSSGSALVASFAVVMMCIMAVLAL